MAAQGHFLLPENMWKLNWIETYFKHGYYYSFDFGILFKIVTSYLTFIILLFIVHFIHICAKCFESIGVMLDCPFVGYVLISGFTSSRFYIAQFINFCILFFDSPSVDIAFISIYWVLILSVKVDKEKTTSMAYL